MAVLAVFMPIAMLGVVLALGRYEDFILTPTAVRGSHARRLTRAPVARSHKGGAAR
ncbi:hypothetical protein ACFYYR_04050 [Streptomyces sp. NPDC001922]|uniref:hypothetical protein n=1 Tax=Streptomyces sp. NPDC001922 TaxID=3364624 RepID=UPI00367CF7A1